MTDDAPRTSEERAVRDEQPITDLASARAYIARVGRTPPEDARPKLKRPSKMTREELAAHLKVYHRIDPKDRSKTLLLSDHSADQQSIISQNPGQYGVPDHLAPMPHEHH